jgi:phenylpropionate dioxygenase-like ring-hydroxylating dioxygenase large terminal subunit
MPPITQRQPILRTLPLVERWGMIFAWHHPHGDAPIWQLPNIPELEDEGYVTPLRRSWPINTAIQELAENGVDYPHLKFLHGTAIVPPGEYKTDGPNAYVDIGNGYSVGHQQGPGDIPVQQPGHHLDDDQLHGADHAREIADEHVLHA